jgi:multidrug efflux system outer membrane protein
MNTRLFPTLLLAALPLLAGCAVGPDYEKPTTDVPSKFEETGPWKEAEPADTIAKGDWWTLFGDPKLNELQEKASAANQDLKAAVARVDQARAVTRVSKSEFYPHLNLDASGYVGRNSQNTSNYQPGSDPNVSDVTIPVDLTYEVDIWGKVRRNVEATTAGYQATVASYETIRLTLHADVAQTYFAIRALDAERALLRETVKLREKALNLVQIKFRGGIGTDLAVAQAETELATTQAEEIILERNRGELEHALAVLLGEPPSSFHLAENPLDLAPPAIPAGLPADLLERRPDVAQAERLMAASNARIGVAKAAFFPTVRLTGAAGFESADLGSVFDWPSRVWSVGPSITLPIFEGGRNSANLSRSESAYVESVATYRQQVLVAFRDVEDGLLGLRVLSGQSEAVGRAVSSAQRAAKLSNIRYQDGLVDYLDVVDSERTLLQNQRQAVQILGQRMVTSVFLVKALGGGWKESEIDLKPGEEKKTASNETAQPNQS